MSYPIANDRYPRRQAITAPTPHYVGLDLGKKRDFTAVAVLAREVEEREPLAGTQYPQKVNTYRLVYLDRTRQESYEAVADGVAHLMRSSQLGTATLAVDETGVGTAVGDMLKARRLTIKRATITAGNAVTRDEGRYGIPKRDLVTVVTILLESRRLVIPKSLALADTLAAELANFRVNVSKLGHDSYGAGAAPEWREGAHDDLVLAVALAAWFGERDKGSSYVEFPAGRSHSFGPFGRPAAQWSPADDDDDDFPASVASNGFGSGW